MLKLQRAVPLLLRLGDHPAGRGAPRPAPHGRPVRAGGQGRPRRLDRAARPPGEGGAPDAGLRDAGLTSPSAASGAGLPRRGRPIPPPGSLAEQAARYGTARYAQDGGFAAIARPVIWTGKLAKVVVVAVPDELRLRPRTPGDRLGRDSRPAGDRPVPAAAAAGPW